MIIVEYYLNPITQGVVALAGDLLALPAASKRKHIGLPSDFGRTLLSQVHLVDLYCKRFLRARQVHWQVAVVSRDPAVRITVQYRDAAGRAEPYKLAVVWTDGERHRSLVYQRELPKLAIQHGQIVDLLNRALTCR